MDFDNIEVFLAVAQTRSLSLAAKSLFLSQSTASYRLKLLEKELDCKLIQRGRGPNQSLLTREGEAFLPIAQRLKGIRYDIESFKEISRSPSVTLGFVESVGLYLLDELYHDLARRNHRVKLHLILNNNDRMYDLVDTGQVDVAYVVEPQRHKGVVTVPVFTEQMVLAASSTIRLEGDPVHPGQLNLRDACQFDWKELSLNHWYEYWFPSRELPFIKTNSPTLAFQFMKRHPCWAVVPHSMGIRLEQEAGMTLHTLQEAPPVRTCFRIISKNTKHLYPDAIGEWDQEMRRYLADKPWITMVEETPEGPEK